MKRRTVTFVCSALYELDVFQRLRVGLERRGYDSRVVTHLFSVKVKAARLGLTCVLSRRPRKDDAPPLTRPTVEVAAGRASPKMAQRFRQSFWEALDESAAQAAPDAIIQWNGLSIAGRTTTDFAAAKGIPVLYLELGNIEPKTFADPEGVGPDAWLSRNLAVLDTYPVTEEQIEAWRSDFIARRRVARGIPQTRLLFRINPWFLVDKAAKVLAGAPAPQRRTVVERLREKLTLPFRRTPARLRPEAPFVFLPLQVSNDSNLLIHAKHDNLAALACAAERARERGLQLVVRPHPADPDIELLSRIGRICEQDGHLLTSLNTMELILAAEEVVTINSTVGMEARAVGKPVTVLGRSVYEGMSERQIAVFAMHHLIDFQPFGNSPASDAAISQLLSLLERPS